MSRNKTFSIVGVIAVVLLGVGCGPVIGKLMIRTWPGSSNVTINSMTQEDGTPVNYVSDPDGNLEVLDVPFPKGAQGTEPIEILVNAQHHDDAMFTIVHREGKNFELTEAPIALDGRQTAVFTTDPKSAAVYVDNVKIPDKKKSIEFKRDRIPDSLDANVGYETYTATARMDDYHDESRTVKYEVGKSEVKYDFELDPVTEELVEEYYLTRDEPTGHSLVVRKRSFWGQRDIAGDRADRITRNTQKNKVINHLSLIRSTRNIPPRLMFTNFRMENGQIFSNIKAIPAEGGAESEITRERNYLDVFPAYDPDNKSIMFSSDRLSPGETFQLCYVNAEKPGATSFISHDTNASEIHVNKQNDGTQIIFTSYRKTTNPNIWFSEIDESGQTQLDVGSYPKYNPEGDRILFIRYKYDDRFHRRERSIGDGQVLFPSELWVMNTNLTNATKLVPQDSTDEIEIRGADWHSDGRHIVFSACLSKDKKGRPNFDIYSITDKGTELNRRTVNDSCDDFPIWSEDGNYVYFRSNRGVAWNIWRIEVPLYGD